MSAWILNLIMMSFSTLAATETTLLLFRHGETDGNLHGRTIGWTDLPLNERGLQQAEELSRRLIEQHADIAAIYSSDLSRAYTTAEPTANLIQIPVVQRFGLREMYFGDGEGCSQEEREKCLSLWKSWDDPIYPNEETYTSLIQRLRNELFDIARNHRGQKVAIFTHGRAIHAITASLVGTNDVPFPGNCQSYVFIVKEGTLEWKGIDS